jgi:16S rRNA (adenine1518-N6/adenine1519-N6)-dimethyltransferase
MDVYSSTKVKKLLEINGLFAKKSLGQNFLIDRNICDKIAKFASLEKTKEVIEIGTGLGSLTQKLAENFEKVLTFEIDSKLISILGKIFENLPNIELINSDALKVNFDEIISKKSNSLSVCANLPYYITTPLVMRFLEEKLPITRVTVMVQKEVAQRFLAKPGNKLCGAVSAAIRFYSVPEFVCNVSKNCFFPIPKVDSSVISFKITNNESIKNKKIFFKIVKSIFSNRRKILLNSLSLGFKISKLDIKKLLNQAKMNENLRAENLTFENLVNLTNIFDKMLDF